MVRGVREERGERVKPGSEAPLVEVDELTMRFATRQGKLTAVDHVSFTVLPGRHLGIVGASGSGKSTVVKLMQRLLRPTKGRVWFGGADITKMSERALRPLRRNMQSVSQNPYASLFPNMTVGQNVIEPMFIHGIGTKQERFRKAVALMTRVGVEIEQFYSFPHEISGGQQQRIAIARALALDPKLLILDEAVSSLDVSIQAQILHLLLELQTEFDLTYVFVSHNLAVVRLICPQVAVMFLGRVVELGPTEAVFTHPSHPYTRALLSAVPEYEDDADEDAASLLLDEVEPPSPYNIPSGCRYRSLCPLAADKCVAEEPPLRPLHDGRVVACHYAEEESA